MLRKHIALGAIAALVVGCTADKPAPTGFVVTAPLYAVGGNGGGPWSCRKCRCRGSHSRHG